MTTQPVRSQDCASAPAPGVRIADARLVLDDGIPLFDGLSLEIAAGQTTCILGPSGIGKSMLLRMILGIVKPGTNGLTELSGSISLSDGRPVSGHAAYMAQQDLLMPWLTVMENVAIGACLRKQDRDPARENAGRLIEAVGLGDALARYPAALSGGMRQRAALARTIAEDRPVILMDEPFSQVDAITRLRLQTLTAELFKDRTVMLVTHDPLEALRLGHRIVVMGGRPADIQAVHTLDSAPPRDPGTGDLLRRHAELLRALEAGQG